MALNLKNPLYAVAITVGSLFASQAFADPLEGVWKRPNGILVKFAACGDGFCSTQISGARAGDQVGKLTPSGGGKYVLTLHDPKTGRSATGSGSVSGNTLTVYGCIFGGLLCKTELWSKQ